MLQYGPGSPNGHLGTMESSNDIYSTHHSGRSFDDDDTLLLDSLVRVCFTHPNVHHPCQLAPLEYIGRISYASLQ